MSAEPMDLCAPAVREALARAAEMRLIGLCFERPRPGRAEEIRALAREDPGQVLADLAAFYRAFAYAPETEEPTDRVAVEAGFVGYLWLKEAYALAQVDTAAAGLTASARGRFIEVHVAAPAATSPAPDPGDEVECACVASELNGDGARDNSSPETANTPRS